MAVSRPTPTGAGWVRGLHRETPGGTDDVAALTRGLQLLKRQFASLELTSEHAAVPPLQARDWHALPSAPWRAREEDLFANLVVSTSDRRRRGRPAFWVSVSAHVALVVAFILGSVFWTTPLPEHPVDYIRVLIYDPLTAREAQCARRGRSRSLWVRTARYPSQYP
jgi:hypothetical protein